MYDIIIVRNGEISVKKKNKAEFENALVKNIKYRLYKNKEVKIQKENGRVEISLANADAFEIIKKIDDIFGVVSMSPAMVSDSGYDNLFELIKRLIDFEMDKDKKTSFKLSIRRIDKSFDMQSNQMNIDMGEKVLKEYPNLYVDVKNPEFEIHCEFRKDVNIVYSKKILGEGGMPRGINGRACTLISGGIDSPVATYLMARRGLFIEAVHFHSYPFTNERSKQKVIDLVSHLTAYCGKIRLHLVNLLDIQKEINEKCPEEYMTILSRRFMMRIAQDIANEYECTALITGESLGQVASQTSLGLLATDNVVNTMPVFRPLIAMEKDSIIEVAKKIGTYDISIIKEEDCCTVFLPKKPATKPKMEKVLSSEEKLDIDKLVKSAIEKREILELKIK
ncbi:tRNA sulfurtransferase ThiI [Peptoanaerobacter stomatis]|uniref:Probable tRNA sulfurtransferase n=1 Tax=Peptoanaerobacter stomatis TaxID=796937 RepID=J4WDF1_9FIRM|nr:tRNA uracil 4-sulfurtransferase ThiI [Peptoanaerobacter stomatis]EJU23466.1 tRNA sulfurtransferase ThiI [Peptoanaerobacter stomatis]NWO24541.1 tRNA 4-thiouridine(8) synthase ThiI [Peptostreptococcaceae bacterium oral taxon 081]